MTKIHPLPIYPSAPTGDDLRLLREAKERLDVDILIRPSKALPRSPGRVIALRERPDWICDYAFIPEPNVESLTNALKWALSDEYDSRAVSIVSQLREIFGNGVQEIV